MIINSHNLAYAKDAGNGYHGNCTHCGVALITDLGYCSWDNLKCIDREVINPSDAPQEVKSYVAFFGMHWDNINRKFRKAYSDVEYTIDDIYSITQSLLK